MKFKKTLFIWQVQKDLPGISVCLTFKPKKNLNIFFQAKLLVTNCLDFFLSSKSHKLQWTFWMNVFPEVQFNYLSVRIAILKCPIPLLVISKIPKITSLKVQALTGLIIRFLMKGDNLFDSNLICRSNAVSNFEIKVNSWRTLHAKFLFLLRFGHNCSLVKLRPRRAVWVKFAKTTS